MNPGPAMEILLVEDNQDHAELTRRALCQSSAHRVEWVKDGQEALDFLQRRGAWATYSGGPPSVILLDIGLPKLNGHEVLRSIKTDERLRCIPVIMLSTSADPGDVTRSYQAGANSYVVKALDFADFTGRVNAIKDYWANTNVFPGSFDPVSA